MKRFTVEHKYCGCIRVVEGYDVWDALKKEGLDYTIWNIKEVEKI